MQRSTLYAFCFYGAVAGYLIGFWYTWFIGWYGFDQLCAEHQWRGACVRDWIAALSGWAAAIAAGITIFFLSRQNAEQKKQTDFLLGDANPTMDATLDLEDDEQIVVRIVNWNRRGLLIWDVDIFGVADSSTGIMELKLDGEDVEDDTQFVYLRGWENRSEGPHCAQYKLTVSVGDELIKEWPSYMVARATVQLFDARHRNIYLEADIVPRSDDLEGWGEG